MALFREIKNAENGLDKTFSAHLNQTEKEGFGKSDSPETACLSQKSGTYFQVTHQVTQRLLQGKELCSAASFFYDKCLYPK